ncbi:L-rhamnose mutarotase [Lentisphaera profundi]|uniref:L-rhamnose mutarotase n=1 Tax=Lentisphaera profundi TaxID=1658616 RepID=A0ABY7VZ43_9BACT|nr:L-rhamnose mutarotase [Lentisphaera profundi]WDE98485.1 L-rhamnose mutarotase [Lentisphaera profundi]
MKKMITSAFALAALASCSSQKPSASENTEPTKVAAIYGATNPKVSEDTQCIRYFGSVVELKGEKEKLYRELHADVWAEVIAAIAKANIRNYHIYLTELQGKKYLFSYFEYHGKDMDKDFESMAEDKTTREKWWPITDDCQQRIPGTAEDSQWMNLESLMHIK